MNRRSKTTMRAILAAGVLAWVAMAPPAGGQTTREGGDLSADFRQIVQQGKGQVFPAVVFIKCIRESHESGERKSEEVAGSGVLITPQGELLTNWHVVDKATEIRCLLLDGRAMRARVVGIDKDTDLALLSLEDIGPDQPVSFAGLGDSSSLNEGDFVMAMGAPWGLNRSVSIGIISCTRRFLAKASQYSLWLQTDASICPGNSGGPLVNTAGQVVGITTLGTFFGGDMGFAVPASTIAEILPQLREHGQVQWTWTGLQLQALRDFEKNMFFDAAEGIIVAETDPDSPARAAGVTANDRIIRINGRPLTARQEEDLPDIRRWIGLLPGDQAMTIDLVRDGREMSLNLTPRPKGRVEGEELDCPRWDLTVKAINQFDNPDLYFYRQKGVFIFGTRYPGNAADSGLRRGDIVLQINHEQVTSLDDARRVYDAAVKNIDTEHRIMFNVLRNGEERQVVLDFARDYRRE